MMDKEDVFARCLERWEATDSSIRYFQENCDEWISQLPDEIQEITLQLLEMFEYYSQQRINDYLVELHSILSEREEFDAEKVLYTHFPSSKGIANSSSDYLISYRQLNRIRKYNVAVDLNGYIKSNPEKYGEIENIVIVDDFCGSGKTLKSFISNHIDIIRGKHIYYLITYLMEESKTVINEISSQYGVVVDPIYINSGKKAFDDKQYSGKEDALRSQIKKYSEGIGIPKQYRLGKYKSESLVSFYNNTPNNTIGLFWFDSENYFSIFPRELENTEGLKRPTPHTLKQQKAARNAQNYCSAARKAHHDSIS